jgi:hypothetical protein
MEIGSTTLAVALIIVGVACLISAVAGGRLQLLNVEIPAVTTPSRQVLLGAVGMTIAACGVYMYNSDGSDKSMASATPTATPIISPTSTLIPTSTPEPSPTPSPTPAPLQAQVTVTFNKVHVRSDADPTSAGEMLLELNVNGQTVRWPDTGTRTVNSGGDYAINKIVTVTVKEGDTLRVYVNGTEDDEPLDDDSMGTIDKIYTVARDWTGGDMTATSTCPDGCYMVYYKVGVVWISATTTEHRQ